MAEAAARTRHAYAAHPRPRGARHQRLTTSSEEWDEHAHISEDGTAIVWMSSVGYEFDPEDLTTLRTDFWIMWADGSSKTRLTYFNDPDHPESTGDRTICGDVDWSPDGTQLVAKVQVGDTKDHVRLMLLNLE